MALCPTCAHPLPDPPAGVCPNCGASLEAGSAPPPPTGPSSPAAGAGWEGAPGTTPWEQRGRIGFFAALVETTRQVLTAPTAFFRAMPVEGGIGSPLLYGVLIGWFGAVVASLYQALFHSIVGMSPFEALGRMVNPAIAPDTTPVAMWIAGWGGFLAEVVFGAVFVAIVVILASAILHLALLLLGGAQRGFEATIRVVSFSQAASLVFLVPFCGQLVGAVWMVVLYVLGLAEAHRIGHGKALAAVLLPLVVFCCCCAAVFGLFFLGVAGLAGRMR